MRVLKRGLQVAGLVMALLSLAGYALLNNNDTTRLRANPFDAKTLSFNAIIAGRDIEYCTPGYAPGKLKAKPCEGAERWGKRTDTILFAHLDGDKLNLISIPRDTKTGEGDTYFDKVNFAFDNGGQQALLDAGLKITDPNGPSVYERAGADSLSRTVEGLLGTGVDYHVIFNVEFVEQVIDALGGVDVSLDNDMDYEDFAANLFIHLKKGDHHLNGHDALGYLRFRHGYGSDYARMDRGKEVIAQLIAKLKSPMGLAALPRIVAAASTGIITNFDLSLLPTLASKAGKVRAKFATLPTAEQVGGSFLYPNVDAIAKMMSPILGLEDDRPDALPTTTLTILDRSGHPKLGTTLAAYLERIGLPKAMLITQERANIETRVLRRASQTSAPTDPNMIVPIINITERDAEAYARLLHLSVATPYIYPTDGGEITLELGPDAVAQYGTLLKEMQQ